MLVQRCVKLTLYWFFKGLLRKVTSYMMNLIVDFGITFGELLSRSESMEVLEKYVNAPPENPKENWGRWRNHAMAAVEELKSAARADQPVAMVCEVQAILRPYLEARKKMHFLYKVARADSAQQNHAAHPLPWIEISTPPNRWIP